MENGKRIEAMDAFVELPEAVIQHIQSFLSGKEAASTAVLSKSWYHSWLTRPSLDFDERYFQNQNSDAQSDERFLNFVMRSTERYHDLNLNIESFRLSMAVRDIDSSSLASELIVRAVNMGANSIDVEYHPPISEYPLPKELFEAESLVELSVFGCRIFGGEVMCSRLKSLSLFKVCIKDDMIRNILVGCPLIENLFLSDCEGFKKVNVSKMAELKRFSVVRHKSLIFCSRPLTEFAEKSVGLVIDNRINVSEFWKLSYLSLERVKIDRMIFCDFLNKFPCLEDLSVLYCDGCVRFNISSHSLKRISLAHTKKLQIKLVDVPNIHKFKFSGSLIPSLSGFTTSSECESDIAFTCWNSLGVSWFLELRNFLTNLSPSQISLSIDLLSKHIDFVSDIRDSPKPIVENLILTVHSPTSVDIALLDGIFWSFQPKVITQMKASSEQLQFLSKKLMDIENSNGCSSTEKVIVWHELEEVNVEYFEDTLMEWRPLPTKALFPEKEVQIRFRLSWG